MYTHTYIHIHVISRSIHTRYYRTSDELIRSYPSSNRIYEEDTSEKSTEGIRISDRNEAKKIGPSWFDELNESGWVTEGR